MLPTIDGVTFNLSRDRFIDLLASFAEWLRNPDWLIYRCGSFVLGMSTGQIGPLSLSTFIEVADRLIRLSMFDGFSGLIEGFRNVTKCHDTVFETRVADLFVSLPTFHALELSPEIVVRGSIKRPDLRVSVASRSLVVEAKVPRLNGAKAGRKFSGEVDCIKAAMASVGWPSDRRLEIEVMSHLSKPMSQVAPRIVARATETREGSFADSGMEVHVLPRWKPFVTNERGFIADVLFGEDRAVSLLEASDVNLRVVNNVLFGKVATSVGRTLAVALSQLPTDEDA